MSHDLSNYEKIRLANIQRNQDYLKSLGLDKPSGSTKHISNREESDGVVLSSSSRTKRSKISEKSNDVVPLRRSSRATPVIKNDNVDDTNDSELPDPIPLGRVDDESDILVERTFPALSSAEFGDHSSRIQISAQSLMDFIIVENIDHSEMMNVKVIRITICCL